MRVSFDVCVLRQRVRVLGRRRLQPHHGGPRRAAIASRDRGDTLRTGAPWRAASARAPPHGREPSGSACAGGGKDEARRRGVGRSTLTGPPVPASVRKLPERPAAPVAPLTLPLGPSVALPARREDHRPTVAPLTE